MSAPPLFSMFLSCDELHELTNRTQSSAQLRVLRAMGIEHRKRPDGSVAVLRSHIQQLFGASNDTRAPKPVEPNWGALNATST